MQVQSLWPLKGNLLRKNTSYVCFLHSSPFYPTLKILCFTMLFNQPDTPKVPLPVRCDTIRLTILTCAQKLTSSQLNLPHGTEQKRIMKKLKPKKRRCSEETVRLWSLWSQSWGWRESMVGKICERGRSWGGSERKRELWMVRVVSWHSEEMW